jgi:hypothetical protein
VIVRTNFFTDVVGPNATLFTAGSYLQLDTTATSAFAPGNLTAVATYTADPSVIRTLNFYTGPIFAEKNFNLRMTNLTRTSGWTLAVSDPSGTASGSFMAIADPEFVPLVLNLRVAPNGTTPTIAWDLPDLSGFDLDRILVRATDAASGDQIFQSGNLSAGATSFVMPDGFLQPGKTYEFRVMLDDFASGQLENRSNTFSGLVTVAIPEPETYALMLMGLAAVGVVARRRSAAR